MLMESIFISGSGENYPSTNPHVWRDISWFLGLALSHANNQ